MRPLRLEMTAFGPYAGREILDFADLNGRTFFLIHGPTGSGKTTILDAICFALYGDTSGMERQGKQMRSDLAEARAATQVTLDFAVGARSYRVQREPEQKVMKKKGEGVAGAKATLWRFAADGNQEGLSVVATGAGKVTDAVEGLLGFKSEQFRQVVILPQGQFRRLLTAGSREREDILEVLFKTEFYRGVEEALKRSSGNIGKQIEESRLKEQTLLQHAGSASAAELVARRDALAGNLSVVRGQLGASAAAEAAAQAELSAAAQVIAQIAELEAASQHVRQLEEQASTMAAAADELAWARKAEMLAPAQATWQRAREQLDAAREAEARAAAALAGAGEAHALAELTFAAEKERGAVRDETQRKLLRLEDQRQRASSLAAARDEAALLGRELAELTAQQKQLAAHEESARQEALAAEQKRAELEAAAGQAESAEQALKDLDDRLGMRADLDECEQQLAGAAASVDRDSRKLAASKAALEQLRAQLSEREGKWRAHQAAILAQALVAGDPCPVCGSCQHPAPAAARGELPGSSEIEELRLEVTAREKEWEKALKQAGLAQAELERLRAKVEASRQALGELAEVSRRDLSERRARAAAACEIARRAGTQISELDSRIAAWRRQAEARAGERAALQVTLSAANDAYQQKLGAIREAEEALPGDCQDPDALEANCRQLGGYLKMLQESLEKAQRDFEQAGRDLAACQGELKGTAEALRAAEAEATRAEAGFNASLAGSGFAGMESFERARRPVERMSRLEKEIKDYGVANEAAASRLARARSQVADAPVPDMAALEEAARLARDAREQLLRQESQLAGEIGELARSLGSLADLAKAIQVLEDEFGVFGRIAEVAGGQNKLGITFQRFVLGALLDDVLLSASRRLAIMSRGRYHLRRCASRTDMRRAGGLDLDVFDTYTGTLRAAATLSGGESFLASLSLALGLADVVQSYAGGIHLETMFVDEGFGSLDPESLDLAVRALIDLQKGGRLVGIISHVPELTERIDARLAVSASRRGSTACFVVP